MSTFLSGTAVALSILALIGSGFAVYQVFEMRQINNTAATSEKSSTATLSQTSVNQSPNPASNGDNAPAVGSSPKASVSPTTTPTPTTTPQATEIKPGEFVQPALTNKAQVELLSAKRIQDPETGNRDVVNLQMRIRRLSDQVQKPTYVEVGLTTARNPNTSETYKAVDPSKRSTDKVDLSEMEKGTSADAYVWLRLPERVSTLDVFVPKTGQFKNVPISN